MERHRLDWSGWG